jgi:aryl-phospho-beta-D-glucosidase BglC (GH1 family)
MMNQFIQKLVLTVCLLLFIVATISTAQSDGPYNKVSNAQDNIILNPILVSAGTGEKNVATNTGGENTQLKGQLVRYGDNLTFNAVANPGESLIFDVTELGYYSLDVSLYRDGNEVRTTSVNYSVVPEIADKDRPTDMGVCVHTPRDNAFSRTFQLIRLAGFTRIRTDLSWESVEPLKGYYVIPNNITTFVNTSEQYGIKPLIVFGYPNAQAYPNGFPTIPFPTTDESRKGCAAALAHAVRYFGDRVTEWELWNEPNYADPVNDYLPLLKVVYPEVKAANPHATLISGGGSGAGGGPGGGFIIPVLDAGGVDFQDGYSIHPYMAPNTPDFGYSGAGGPIAAVNIPTVWPFLKKIAEDRLRSDNKELSIWVTELGWNSTTNNDIEQAAYFARSYLLSRRHYMTPGLFWYDLQNDGDDPTYYEHNFGLLRTDFSPKPSFQAAAVVASFLKNSVFLETLLDGVNKVLAFGQNGEPTFYTAWTTKAEGAIVNIRPPLAVERLSLIDWQGREMSLVVENGRIVLSLDILPQYLVVKNNNMGVSGIKRNDVKLFPNPSTGQLTLNLGYTGNHAVTINDLNGRTCLRKMIHEPITRMDISHLANGVYLVSVNEDLKQTIIKIKKQ